MKRKNLINILLFIFVFILFPINAHAVTFSVNKSADNLKPGNDFTVEIKASVESSAALKEFELQFRYDASIFDYVNGVAGDGIALDGSNGALSMSKTDANYNSDFTVATLNFKVKSNANAGNSTFTLVQTKCAKNQEVECKANSSQVTVASLGSDPTLKSLKIPNTTLSPEFNKNTFDYSASVKDVTEVTVNAVPNDSSSKIQISENYKNLQKGDNLIKVVVTAETGATKTYNINVNLSLTPTDEELLKANATLSALDIKNQKIDFKSDEKKYYLTVPYKISSLKITPTAANPNAKVEIDATKLKVGKNTITITVTSEDTTNTEKYQIIVTREKQEKKIVQTCPDVTSNREWILFTIITMVIFTVGILLGFFLCKKDVLKKIFKKKEKKEEEPVEVQTLSDTIEINTDKINEELGKTKKLDKVKDINKNE